MSPQQPNGPFNYPPPDPFIVPHEHQQIIPAADIQLESFNPPKTLDLPSDIFVACGASHASISPRMESIEPAGTHPFSRMNQFEYLTMVFSP